MTNDYLCKAPLGERDAVLVLREPAAEGLQRGIQRARRVQVARGAELRLELLHELEHVAELRGPRETELAVLLGRQRVVGHLLAQLLRECGGHLRAGQVVAGDTDGLAEEVEARLEDAV